MNILPYFCTGKLAYNILNKGMPTEYTTEIKYR